VSEAETALVVAFVFQFISGVYSPGSYDRPNRSKYLNGQAQKNLLSSLNLLETTLDPLSLRFSTANECWNQNGNSDTKS
jgi:hypothetical protein